MDLGSLIAAMLLSIGMIGADAVINADAINFKVEVTEDLSKRGYTQPLVDSLIDNSLKQLVDYRSFVRPPKIRSSEEKSIVGAIAQSLNLQDVTAAFQAGLGLNPVRLTGTLMPASAGGEECGRSRSNATISAAMADGKPTRDATPREGRPASRAAEAAAGTVSATAAATPETGARSDEQLRFILSGQSVHTGMFVVDCTSAKGQPLPVFMNVVAIEIVKRVEPYAAAIALFSQLHRTHALMRDGAAYTSLKSFIEARLASETEAEDTNRDYAVLRNLLGMASMMANKNEDAEREFILATEIDPHLGYPSINAGLLYLSQKRFDKALEMIARAISTGTVRNTSFLLANALTVEGLALWGQQDLPGAADAFLQAARAYPRTFFAYYYWSKLMATAGNPEAAAILSARANANLSSFETYPESALLYFKVMLDQDFKLIQVNLKTVKSVAEIDAMR